MASELKPVEPKTPRWEPTTDPNNIVVPGLNTNAPPYDQIEQIEQLITIKLQNIDANFSKIQNIMANRILPAVKKYAVGTQPVREASKFWTTFYEQAAQIRIPTYDDYSTGQEQEASEASQTETENTPAESSTHSETQDQAATPQAHHTFNPDATSSEVSFAPGQAVMSTPATEARARAMNPHDSFASQGAEPWTTSLESPLRQLNRDIRSLSEDRSAIMPTASTSRKQEVYDASADVTQRPVYPDAAKEDNSIARDIEQGKAGKVPQPLLNNVLRRNANTSTVTSSSSHTTSPLKFKPKTPVLKKLNPYLPPDSQPSDWTGVVDLKDPSVASPRKTVADSAVKLATFKPPAGIGFARARTKTPPPREDDSFDDNFGMSPPVMTDYARLPTKLGRTPMKEAAERIMKSLVDIETRGVFAPATKGGAGSGKAPGTTRYGTESSMSSMPTPPSMTRYTRSPYYAPRAPSETNSSVTDSSLDSIMRRVGLNVPGYGSVRADPPPPPSPVFQPPRAPVFSAISSISSVGSMRSATSSVFRPPTPPRAAPPPPPQPERIKTPEPHYYYEDDDGQNADFDADDSMDSFEEEMNDGPAPVFQFGNPEDSFDDDSFDSMGDMYEPEGDAAPFMLAPADDVDDFDDDDDSFDDHGEGEEETVFGVPPAQRLHQQAQGGHFRMHGENLFQDTIGIGAQMAMAGRVEESPTPWNNASRE